MARAQSVCDGSHHRSFARHVERRFRNLRRRSAAGETGVDDPAGKKPFRKIKSSAARQDFDKPFTTVLQPAPAVPAGSRSRTNNIESRSRREEISFRQISEDLSLVASALLFGIPRMS